MTNPSNAVEKPATGCGCNLKGKLCPEGERLYQATAAAWRRMRSGKALRAEYEQACEPYRAHVEASNG